MKLPRTFLLLLLTSTAVVFAGCSSDTGARSGIDRVKALGHPLVQGTLVRGDWLDGDAALVYVANDATDADARTVWCDVMIPSGLSEGKLRVHLATADQRHLWPMPRHCDDPDDIPKRSRY